MSEHPVMQTVMVITSCGAVILPGRPSCSSIKGANLHQGRLMAIAVAKWAIDDTWNIYYVAAVHG